MKCNPDLLWTLVEQDQEPGGEAESIARHVESCVHCQRTLDDLGGDAQWWQDTRQWLTTSELKLPLDPNDSDSESTAELAAPPVDLGFLDPPTHPEMLGRIGRYEVEGLLGRGGMGVVLRAYDQELRRSVAVKVLAPEWAASPQARQRFAREAQAAASITHENVIPIYNVESDAPLPYLVMRYVPGMTLEHWVRTEGPPDVATLLRVAGQMAEGLAAAHRRGLIHRDIKPGNILIGQGVERVWITDFGLARAADSVTLTRTGVIAGTPHYMSPEQARGESLRQQSDLFSLGGVLFFLATGHPPFDAENTLAVLHQLVSRDAPSVHQFRSDLPPSFVDLVACLLSRTPHKRPASAEVVLRDLETAQAEFRDGKTFTHRWFPRDWGYRSLLIVGAMLMMATGIYPFWKSGPESDQTIEAARDLEAVAVNDPFGAPQDEANIDASGYEIEASAEIAGLLRNDWAVFYDRVSDIANELSQSHSDEMDSLSPLSLGDEAWDSTIQELHQSLDRLEANAIPTTLD